MHPAAQSDEQAIRRLVDVWLQASEKGELSTILNLVAEDVLFLVPNKEPFGKEVFAQNYKQMQGTSLKAHGEIQEIEINGDWAWMRNFLSVTFTPAEGTSSLLSGQVLTILRKNSDGNWLIVRDANLLTPTR